MSNLALLDAVADPLERIRLAGRMAAAVTRLNAAVNPLDKVKASGEVASLLRALAGPVAEPAAVAPKIRNFGWDAVKLSDLSFDELRTLREQVEAEHANPRDENGRYLENGRQSLYLYDKKGRHKLDKLAWAVTYKLKEQKDAQPAHPDNGRAPSGGMVGMNGEFYKGGAFLPRTTLPKGGSVSRSSGTGRKLIEPGVWDIPPSADAKSILSSYGEFIHVSDGKAAITERPDLAIAAYVDDDVAEGRAFLRAAVDAYNKGMRWFVPGDIVPTTEHYEEQDQPADPDAQPEIIEHTTGRGKVIRGVIRKDLSYAEAKAIDEYSFKKDGGWFIRLKHVNMADPDNQES